MPTTPEPPQTFPQSPASPCLHNHQPPIIFRDLKPANVMIGESGHIFLIDFGIARAMWAAQASHLTQTGMVMGTASYVSPEQATGGKEVGADVLDRRTAFGDGSCVFQRERLATTFFAGGIAHRSRLGDDHCIRTEAAQQAGDGAIQARDDRAHADYSAGTDDHSEHRQERPHF
ncbi:hypothetical protein B4Q13_17630, partial [Lacticaseibacillus rhamnosus]